MHEDSPTRKRTRRTYTDEIKAEALRLFDEGRGVGEVSRALDVPRSTAQRWRKALQHRADQTAQYQPDRNHDGTFKPGNLASPNGASTAVQRAKTRAQDLSEDIVDRLHKAFLRAEAEHIEDPKNTGQGYLMLSMGRELLDRGLGKPKQTQEITERAKFSAEDLAEASKYIEDKLAALNLEDEEGV